MATLPVQHMYWVISCPVHAKRWLWRGKTSYKLLVFLSFAWQLAREGTAWCVASTIFNFILV